MIFEKLPKWNENSLGKPILGKLVIIFRYESKSYVVGRLEDNEKRGFGWRSESGNLLNMRDKDLWMYVEPVTLTERYD